MKTRISLALLLFASCAFADELPVPSGKISLHELSPDRIYTVAIPLPHQGVTTIQFPGPVEAVIADDFATDQGGGGSAGATRVPEQSKIFVSHRKGASWIAVKSITPETTNLNVIFNKQVYVLMLVPTVRPAYLVKFLDDPGVVAPDKRLTRDELLTYIDKCKAWTLVETQRPGETLQVDHVQAAWTTRLKDLELVVTDAWRFEREDLVIFRCRLTNYSTQPAWYNPASFAIGVGHRTYFATVADADGAVPAATVDGAGHSIPGTSVVYIGLYRSPDGKRNGISPHQPVRVLCSTEAIQADLPTTGNSLDDIGNTFPPPSERPAVRQVKDAVEAE